MVLDYVVPTPKGTSWGMTRPPQKKTVGYTNCSIYVNLNGWCVVFRSGWNVRKRGLHSQEADAPNGLARHGHSGRAQVWLGV